MAFTRIRTIKGHDYLYREERYREGGKVRSRSICLGPISQRPRASFRLDEDTRTSWLAAQFPRRFGIDWEKIEREELARMKAADAKRAEVEKTMYDAYGMTFGATSSVPIDKPASKVTSTAVTAASPAEQSEADETAESATTEATDSGDGDAPGSDSST